MLAVQHHAFGYGSPSSAWNFSYGANNTAVAKQVAFETGIVIPFSVTQK